MIIEFLGRELSGDEKQQLLNIVSEKSDLNIIEPKKMIEEKPENNEALNQENKYKMDAQEDITMYYKGVLRSGQVINYEGSVVIYGDINPGASVNAKGDIIVLGMARGNLHAGYRGNSYCKVSATCLAPVQLRIANKMSIIPREKTIETVKKHKQFKIEPMCAFIKDKNIYIQQMN